MHILCVVVLKMREYSASALRTPPRLILLLLYWASYSLKLYNMYCIYCMCCGDKWAEDSHHWMSLLYVSGMSMSSTFILHINHEEFECSIVCMCVCSEVCVHTAPLSVSANPDLHPIVKVNWLVLSTAHDGFTEHSLIFSLSMILRVSLLHTVFVFNSS